MLASHAAGKVLSRDLTQQLNNAIQFLVQCRPLSISMGNAIKYLKLQVRLTRWRHKDHVDTLSPVDLMGACFGCIAWETPTYQAMSCS